MSRCNCKCGVPPTHPSLKTQPLSRQPLWSGARPNCHQLGADGDLRCVLYAAASCPADGAQKFSNRRLATRGTVSLSLSSRSDCTCRFQGCYADFVNREARVANHQAVACGRFGEHLRQAAAGNTAISSKMLQVGIRCSFTGMSDQMQPLIGNRQIWRAAERHSTTIRQRLRVRRRCAA